MTIIDEIKQAVSQINPTAIKVRKILPYLGAASRQAKSIARYKDLYETFLRYAEQSQSESEKRRMLKYAQSYKKRLDKLEGNLLVSQKKIDENAKEIDEIIDYINQINAIESPEKMVDPLELLIASMKNLGLDTKELESLLDSLLQSLQKPFIIILEYAVSTAWVNANQPNIKFPPLSWRKSGDGIVYAAGDKGGRKLLQIRFTFDPRLETPKDFVIKLSRVYSDNSNNIYYQFHKAFVSKNPKAWERLKNSLVRTFPSDEDRQAYSAYLELHKDEIKKYLARQEQL